MDPESNSTPTSEPAGSPSQAASGDGKAASLAATKPEEPKQLSVAMRIGIVVVIGLIVLAMQAFLNNLTVQRAREDERVAGVQAVAAALRPIVLGSEKDRAKVHLDLIVKAGDYESAAIIKDGAVWAASSGTKPGDPVDKKVLHDKGETTAGGTERGFQVTTGILAGPENPAGYLQVNFKP